MDFSFSFASYSFSIFEFFENIQFCNLKWILIIAKYLFYNFARDKYFLIVEKLYNKNNIKNILCHWDVLEIFEHPDRRRRFIRCAPWKTQESYEAALSYKTYKHTRHALYIVLTVTADCEREAESGADDFWACSTARQQSVTSRIERR